MFNESKETVTQNLLVLLQSTRAFQDSLQDMTYAKHDTGDETVSCFFKFGDSTDVVNVNVTADSGIALIRDVLKGLNDYI